ncbi:MAG: DUF945 family protein [Sulfurovum sp.]|nr:DUF945 family protein [Sulfurovum sp.]
MKRIMTVVGVLVLGWLGATAYISSTFKDGVEQYIDRVNALYASQGMHYKAEVESSFFTSDLKIEIDFDKERFGKIAADIYADFITLPLTVEYKVEHGPIFYRDGLGIGFAKFTAQMKASEMLAQEPKEKLLKAIPEDITLYLSEVLCFDKQLKIAMHSSAVAIEENGAKMEISPLNGRGMIDTQTLLGSFDITLPKISLEREGINAVMTGTTLQMDMKEILAGKYLLGDGAFRIAKISMTQEGLSKSVEMDFAMDFKTEREVGDYMMADIAVQFNQEGLEQLDTTTGGLAKQVNFSMKLQGISMDALQKFEAVNQKQLEMTDTMYGMMTETDPDKAEAALQRAETAQEDFMKAATEALKALLVKERTKVSAAVDITKDDAKSSLSLTVGYVGGTLNGSLEEMVAYLQAKPLEYLALDADLDFNEKHLTLNPSPEAQQQAKMGFDMAVMQGIMNFENGVYSTKLEYKPKVLKINGQDKSREILPMLEMSLAQGR